MRFVEKKILEERLQHFVEDLNPVELLPYLKCLVDTDKEKIECDSRNDGETRATRTLVDRLKKRGNEAFTEFVRALRETGCDHVAMLLDPLYNVAQGPMEEDSKDECSTRIRTMGTAIDVPLQAHITDEDGNRILELEKEIANTFSKARSQASREIRKKFSEKLPQGATFLHTKSGSIVTMFRLSKVDAAESLLEMCNGSQIVDILTELLLTNEIRGKVPDREPKLTLNITKDWFSHAKKKLEVIESGLRSGKEFEIQNCQDDENFTDDLPNFYIPPVLLDDGKSQSVLPLDLRGYQKELSEKALEGHNTVICAPTNSGKTYVALNIARNHLDKKKEQEQEGKVLFIVSTVNLVQQQTERFKLYLQDKYIVKDISGSNGCDIPLSGLLGSSHVVVLTAQILVNALKDGSLQLSSVSLLVFDECHHTQKDHPYNKIMENYMTLRLQPAHSMPTPQIVGLTASLGVGKAKNTLEAQHHILEVCANMDAQHVVTVQDETNLEELRLHVGTPQRTVHSVTCDRTDVFESVIGKAMEQVELYVKGTPVDTDMPPSGKDYSNIL